MSKKLIIFSLAAVLTTGCLLLPVKSGEALDETSHEPELIINGSFENATPSWYLEDPNGVAVLGFTRDNFDVESGEVSALVHVTKNQANYQVQLKEENLSLPAGYYQLSFYAKADPRILFGQKASDALPNAVVALTQQNVPWGSYGLWYEFSPGRGYQQFSIDFILKEKINDGRLTFYLGSAATTYFVDGVQFNRVTVPEDRTNNLVLNGSFEYPDLGRWSWEDQTGQATFTADNGVTKSGIGSARIDIAMFDRNFDQYTIQLKQNKIPLERGRYYKFSFAGKISDISSTCQLAVAILNDESPWGSAGFVRTYDLGYDWQTLGDTFMSSQDLNNARVSFQLGRCKGSVYIDDVKLVQGT